MTRPTKRIALRKPIVLTSPYPDLPEGVTSFGAAVCDDAVYTYGGHCGRAHEYYVEGQSNQLRRLSLSAPEDWEEVSTGPRLQGLGMAPHAGKLYRVGGFSARNQRGEENDLWSTPDFARFDPATGIWKDLADMPTPRSSHDAAVIGDELYVVGGWTLAGAEESSWQETALVADLAEASPVWREIPAPPFQRRALATVGFQGRLYVIGGMQYRGGPTAAVAIFDPQDQAWTSGPDLPGPVDEGFGAAACVLGDSLYVSTVGGNLLRLDADAKEWALDGRLPTSRFFHRMLPTSDGRLLLIGGANMETGRFRQVDVITPSRGAA